MAARLACAGTKCVVCLNQNALTMTAEQILSTRSLRLEYSQLALAESFISRCDCPSKWAIVLGDNEKFWVLSNRDASILMKAGYELA